MHLQSQRCDLKARYFQLIIHKHTIPTQTTRRITKTAESSEVANAQ